MANEEVRRLLSEYGLKSEECELTLKDLADAYIDQRLLISIGRNLNVERDLALLLRMILDVSRKITGADAGSIFLLEDQGQSLRFKYSETFSCNVDYQEFTMRRDAHSIAGYVSITGQTLNFPDVYELGQDLPFRFNRSFDTNNGYRTKSMLVVPMKNHLGEAIGVIQLINSKEDPSLPPGASTESIKLECPEDFERKVVPFKPRYDSLMVAVANQAAIALENSRMIKQIQEQFESFVSASVTAVESRDPATSGHSHRVAALSVALALALNQDSQGAYAQVRLADHELKELRYAGLLHDFGKVYIDPQVFLKAKKLYPRDYDYLMMRINYLYRSIELGYSQRQVERLRQSPDQAAIEETNAKMAQDLEELLKIQTLISILNEPKPLDCDPVAEIGKILDTQLPEFAVGKAGEAIPLLTPEEITNLSIKRGSLNEAERKIIESHVEHTYAFVSKIPWPPEFSHIPEYAYCHHELLDGSGYPRGLKEGDIPLQARILAVCDIFDALAASDRPYKKALDLDKILDILGDEGGRGKLDGELVRILCQGRIWEGIDGYERLRQA